MALSRARILDLIESLEHLQSGLARRRNLFDQLEAYVVFVGYPKSGHSLIGALLDAHPDMVIAHELDSLRCLKAGLGREPLLMLTLGMASDFHDADHEWNGHRYHVAGQWQGRHRHLRVLGDKKGGGTSRHLRRHPDLLDRLRATLRLPVKVIHVVRHPLDNILAMQKQFGISQQESSDLYFSMAQSVAILKARLGPGDLHEVRYEDFVADPARHLDGLCRFLGQRAEPTYLQACAKIVSPEIGSAHRRADPPDALLESVTRSAARYEFLNQYEY